MNALGKMEVWFHSFLASVVVRLEQLGSHWMRFCETVLVFRYFQ